jgi:Kef-type K+ transport system membrane component KefB
LIIVGILAIIFNAVAISVDDYLGPVGHGFWCGVFFIVTGSFGIGAKSKNKCLIITFMVLCIISSVLTTCLLGLGLGAAINQCEDDDYYYYVCGYRRRGRDEYNTAIAMESLLAILAVVAAVASIWGSVICCGAVCCCNYAPTYGVIVSGPYANQQVLIVSQSQQQYARPQVMPAPAGPPAYPLQMGTAYPAPQFLTTGQPPVVSGGYMYGTVPSAAAAAGGANGIVSHQQPPAYHQFDDQTKQSPQVD